MPLVYFIATMSVEIKIYMCVNDAAVEYLYYILYYIFIWYTDFPSSIFYDPKLMFAFIFGHMHNSMYMYVFI